MGALTPGNQLPVGTSIGEVPQGQPARTQYCYPVNVWRRSGGSAPSPINFEFQINAGFYLSGMIAGTYTIEGTTFVPASISETKEYTASIYINTSLIPLAFGTVKATSCTLEIVNFTGLTTLGTVSFNPSNGTITGTTGAVVSTQTELFASENQDGDQIPVLRVAFTLPLTAGDDPFLRLINVGGQVLGGGAQIEDGSMVSDYIPIIAPNTTASRPLGVLSSYLVSNSGSYRRNGGTNGANMSLILPGNTRRVWLSAAAGGGGGGAPSGTDRAGAGGSAGACVYRLRTDLPVSTSTGGVVFFQVGEGGNAGSAGTDTIFGTSIATPEWTLNGGAAGSSSGIILNPGVAGGVSDIVLAETDGFVVNADGGASEPGFTVFSYTGSVPATAPVLGLGIVSGTANTSSGTVLIEADGNTSPIGTRGWATGPTNTAVIDQDQNAGNAGTGNHQPFLRADLSDVVDTFDTLMIAGKGGSNFFAVGGKGAQKSIVGGSVETSSASATGSGPGAGGGGGVGTSTTGALAASAGNDGFILIEW